MAHVQLETNGLHPKHSFTRGYQACIGCRARKVKCDLGDPGNPDDPPCRRCRREQKECEFENVRTKKTSGKAQKRPRPQQDQLQQSQPEHQHVDSNGTRPVKNSRSDRVPALASASPPSLPIVSTAFLVRGPVSSANHHISAPMPATVTTSTALPSQSESSTADRILHQEVYNANEALNLLYEAAAETRSESGAELPSRNALNSTPSGCQDQNTTVWRDFWCVKAGWMTATEARTYIDLCHSFISVILIP